MILRAPPIAAALAVAAFPVAPAAAAPVCGIDAQGIAAIRAKVAADPRFKRDGGDGLHEVWSAESIQAIWTFATPKAPAYPAALCEQVVTDNGNLQIDRHPLCEAGAKACAAFLAESKARDDGSGDGA